MSERLHHEGLHHEVRVLVDLLGCLANSYRMESAAAEEMNRHALVHRHDAEDAIKRVDDLGEIIDDVQGELKHLMKTYLKDMSARVDDYEKMKVPDK